MGSSDWRWIAYFRDLYVASSSELDDVRSILKTRLDEQPHALSQVTTAADRGLPMKTSAAPLSVPLPPA